MARVINIEARMRIEFGQARAALVFLKYHQIESSIFNYGTALAHLSGSYKTLSDDMVSSIEGAGLTDVQFVELGVSHAAAVAKLGADPETSASDVDDRSIAVRLVATELSVAELREQVAALMAAVGAVTGSAAVVGGHGNGIEEARARLQGAMLAGGNRAVL